jgi:peptidoglycan/xylan/chitin deacetylase (PgdA/CDA1 family)
MTRAALAVLTGALLLSVTGACQHQRPTPKPAPSPSHSENAAAGSPSASAQADSGNPFLARVPTFPAAPTPQPIALPASTTGKAPFFSRLPTTQKVAFLTIDDGYSQAPDEITLMRAAHIPFTMFLIAPIAAQNPTFFRQLVTAGGIVGDHTITHPSLRGRSYAFQHHEMCDSAPTLKQVFGQQPRLFRPPFGNYDSTTLKVAHDCGYTAVLNWSETVDKGIVRYQTADHTIHAGDIILMHFRPAFIDDVLAALNAIKAAGLTPAVLSDYLLPPGSSPPPQA